MTLKEHRRPRACGHDDCSTSSGIHDCLTFGRGHLDPNGFWEIPCAICARAFEQAYPQEGPCWPHSDKDLQILEAALASSPKPEQNEEPI